MSPRLSIYLYMSGSNISYLELDQPATEHALCVTVPRGGVVVAGPAVRRSDRVVLPTWYYTSNTRSGPGKDK